MPALEAQISEWRRHVGRSRGVQERDVEELEAHVREQIDALGGAGLADDEAFLVAVKRMGAVDAISREFALGHSGRLWNQLLPGGVPARGARCLRRPAGGGPRTGALQHLGAQPGAAGRSADRLQLVAVGSALVLDAVVLAAMVARIGDLGWTPNRVAALGLNLLLLVNLAGAAQLSVRFLTGRVAFHRLERWQTTYLPAYGVWAAAVVALLPPLFGFA